MNERIIISLVNTATFGNLKDSVVYAPKMVSRPILVKCEEFVYGCPASHPSQITT